MSKRRRILTRAELEKIVSEIDLGFLRDSHFAPDNTADSVESSDGEIEVEPYENIEDVLQDLALEEAEDETKIKKTEMPISSVWSEYAGRHKFFLLTGPSGLQKDVPAET